MFYQLQEQAGVAYPCLIKQEVDLRKTLTALGVPIYVGILLASVMTPFIYSTTSNIRLVSNPLDEHSLWLSTDTDSVVHHTPLTLMLRELKSIGIVAYTNTTIEDGVYKGDSRLKLAMPNKTQESELLRLLDWSSFGDRSMPAVNADSIFPDDM